MPIVANWLATKARTLKTGKGRQFFQRTARAGIKNRNYSEGKDLLLGFIAASLADHRPVRARSVEIKRLFARGLSKREIAKRLKVGRTSVRRVLTQKGPRP
jgi:DNA-binding NarL/FixJ family response regulator